MKGRARTAAVALVLVLTLVAVAAAHMALSKSAPEADAVLSESPHHIQIWFTQDPDPAVSQVTLEGPSGELELGQLMIHDDRSIMAMVESSLPSGKYTVNWRSAGDDGHTQRGDFAFTVQTAN